MDIQVCHLNPVNEFSEFNEFPLDTCGTIVYTDVICHLSELTTNGKLFFTLVAKITHV